MMIFMPIGQGQRDKETGEPDDATSITSGSEGGWEKRPAMDLARSLPCIDECFADLTGLRRLLKMSYLKIAERIKRALDAELGFTFSVGLAPNKVVAKIASKWAKPSGLTVIPGRELHRFLAKLPVEKVWGIGPNTTAFLNKHGIRTALEYAQRQEPWVQRSLSKPFYHIWQELNGQYVFE